MIVPKTSFAPAERACENSISADAKCIAAEGLVEHLLNTVPYVILILNEFRQIVYNNQYLLDLLGEVSDRDVLGKRPGEILDCIHSDETPGGCGTTEFCRECGAVNAIILSQSSKSTAVRECRILNTVGDPLDFRVWAAPYIFEGRQLTAFSLHDIRHEKRRQVLERTFFHDLNNIVTVLISNSMFLASPQGLNDVKESVQAIHIASKELASEIESHKRLLKAESGELAVNVTSIRTRSLLDEVALVYGDQSKKGDQTVIEFEEVDDVEITSDRELLLRVLGNMVRNALEATSKGGTVTISCRMKGSSTHFSVHNHGYMHHSTQHQLFQRSFTTKGAGRGIGTYSMKLFGQRYLRGKVWFTTSEEEGTTFHYEVPNAYPDSE